MDKHSLTEARNRRAEAADDRRGKPAPAGKARACFFQWGGNEDVCKQLHEHAYREGLSQREIIIAALRAYFGEGRDSK